MIFNEKLEGEKCIAWIKDWFETKSGGAKGCVLGISGGKDSTIVAALLCKAIGKEKILGVLMPNGEQRDIDDGKAICKFLDIKSVIVNIKDAYDGIVSGIEATGIELDRQPKVNISPRMRMSVLYAIGQQYNYRVAGTGNLSERYVGYATKWGDMANDFNPIGSFTSDEVVAIGKGLGLPHDLIYKPPADGLTGKTDEENLGFTYEVLNKYIRTGVCEDLTLKEKIDKLHTYNTHKIEPISIYQHK